MCFLPWNPLNQLKEHKNRNINVRIFKLQDSYVLSMVELWKLPFCQRSEELFKEREMKVPRNYEKYGITTRVIDLFSLTIIIIIIPENNQAVSWSKIKSIPMVLDF